jgi:anti-anti-sigma factor
MLDNSLTLEFESHGLATVANITNATMLDTTNVISFGRQAIDYINDHSCANMLINFEQIQYMSSAGLTELLRINEALKPQHGAVHLFGINSDIFNVFRITNLDTVFVIHTTDTIDLAIEELGGASKNSPTEPKAIQPETGT